MVTQCKQPLGWSSLCNSRVEIKFVVHLNVDGWGCAYLKRDIRDYLLSQIPCNFAPLVVSLPVITFCVV